nr:hypothetical protein [Bacteroidales bacterium]
MNTNIKTGKNKIILINKGVLALFISLFIFSHIFSQERLPKIKKDSTGYVHVTGMVEKNNKPLENASIIVYKNNKKINHLRTPPNGKFVLKFDFNLQYKVEILKQGMVTKRFEFDTKLPVGYSDKAVFPFQFTIVLFPNYKYIDMSILEKPLAIIRFDKSYEDFFYDYNYAKTINDKVMYIQGRIEQLTKEYAKCVEEGRAFFDKKEYLLALNKFVRANEIFPDEPYPIERIALIKKLLGEKKNKRAIYEALVAEADEKVKQTEYESAITYYEQALDILPSELYPQQRIRDLKKILANMTNKESNYNHLITKGDQLFDMKKYAEARRSYADASNLFPERPYPKDRIAEIDRITGRSTELLEKYNLFVAQADKLFNERKFKDALNPYKEANKILPEEKYPKDKIAQINKILYGQNEKDEAYRKVVTVADKLFDVKDYQNARIYYQKGLEIKPDENHPKERINQINALLGDIASQSEAYKKLVAEGDRLFKIKKYKEARNEYQNAYKMKPDEQYPKAQMDEIDKILANMADIQKKYDAFIKDADKFFANQDLLNARDKYQAASDLKPDEKYPLDKINQINNLLNDREAKMKNYNELIAKADKLFDYKQFTSAKENYLKALDIFPNENHPKDRIAEIDKIFALDENYKTIIKQADTFLEQKNYNDAIEKYKSALLIKPDEEYPKKQIDKINKLLADFQNADEAYKKAITEGDRLLRVEEFSAALDQFKNALLIKPSEQYPKDKIAEINKILAEKNALRLAYDKKIAEADKFFAAKDYIKAKETYIAALDMRPDEAYPKKKIAEIDDIFKILANKEKEYDEIIKNADKLFNEKQYDNALNSYQQALKLKPQEKYPKDKIDEINKIFGEKKSLQLAYDRKIVEADKLLKDKEYQKSKDAYYEALTIKPGEEYPQKKINEIDNIFKDLAAKEQEYKDLIIKADNLFNQKNFEDALSAYQQALQMKPLEKYPKDQIAEINKIFGEKKTL